MLHLEAHGSEAGLTGPNGTGDKEFLSWDELTDPLQRLNLATQCNLLVFVAACNGFAGIKAFYRGPRAPAVALVGPDSIVAEANLLWGTKEFYRRYMDESPRLTEIVGSASREAGTVEFEKEPFALLAFESMIKAFIHGVPPRQWMQRLERIRARIPELQLRWNELFMIDLWPANQERFGLDITAVVESLSKIKKSDLFPTK
ncbi:MAG: hypothetical protein AB7Y74_00815 [Syntrophorhabdus sp.]